ncbi:MAG: alpha/beta hydrolase [Bacilli bacterium]|nr:alpha/beta hydrolase [Bacilli bacterium]
MDPRKVLQNVFTALNIADAVKHSENGALDPSVALSAFFSRRFSDEEGYKHNVDYLVWLIREEIPELAHRETVRFPSSGNTLCGYLYRTPSSITKGLVLYVHGIMGCADDKYAIAQAEFLRRGYDVLAIDLTCSGRSGGSSISGLQQSAYDVVAAYRFILSRNDLKNLPLYFFGHSWGAYGVAASLGLGAKPHAIAAMSGFDEPLKEMLGLPSEKAGVDLSFLGKQGLEEALRQRVGENYDLSASRSVLDHPDVSCLVIHGDNDHTVPLKGVSTFDALSGKGASFLLRPGAGHMDIFYSLPAREYAKQAMESAKDLLTAYGGKYDAIPESEKQRFASTYDKRMCSVLDKDLFDRVDEFFLGHATKTPSML